jgi:predicted molibdopterin-dependent oxidoreductase YjgC
MVVSLTINGIPVKAEAGMTVLEAAKANDIYIPTLCHHPKLTPAGACRLCVVEIEKMRGFSTACTVPVSDGMIVRTDTETLQNMRREILSLILSEHPYTCLVCGRRSDCDDFQSTVRKAAVTTGCQYCPMNGQCDIQELVERLGLRDIPYPVSYRGLPVEQDDPFFDRDYNLCILCGRCVRVCQDVRHAGVLAFTYRGSQALVGTAFGRSHLEVDCQFCGACVDVCPTGALADKRGKWEGVPTATVPSVCPYCSVGCAVNVQVKNGRVIRTVGRDDGPTNDGQLCVRGRFGVVDIVHSLSRLKTPLVRRNGRLVEASWDEALEVVAQGLKKFQGDGFAIIGSATSTNEESYALQKFARVVMHSNNVALSAGFPTYDDAEELVETLRTIGGPAIRDIRSAACILAIGTNVFDSHPIIGVEIRHALNKGAHLITVDTRETNMAKRSGTWLQPKIGTDHVLLAGMIKTLADKQRTLRSPELAHLDLAKVEAITGVKKDAIIAASQTLVQHTPAIVIYGSGVTHYPTALDVIKAINDLAFVVGDLRIISVPGEGNFVGAYDMGVHPTLLPGYRPLSSPETRKAFEARWKTSLNATAGRSFEDILAGVRKKEIRALYLAGEIPPLKELANLEFVVVQDIVPTENLKYAHVVLPATTFVEMDGTLTNLEGRVQRLRQAIPPVGLPRPGWMIARDLANLMGAGDWNYQSAADVMNEIASLVPAYRKVNYETLDVSGALRRFEPVSKPKFVPFSLDTIPRITNDEFPLALITERNLFYYHGACLTEQVKGMNLVKNEEVLQLSPSDLTRFGITDGSVVKVTSQHGSAECVVEASRATPEGAAFTSINRVTGSPLFPTLAPSKKACAIRIAGHSSQGDV